MGSYDSLMAMEQPWPFLPAFPDPRISDAFTSKDSSETLTQDLQSSFATNSSDGGVFKPDMAEFIFSKPDEVPVRTPSASGGSENEAHFSKQHRSVPPSGRVAKRKSGASKRVATTTYITADPANFRRMVQQVTGVTFGGRDVQLPEALMAPNRIEPGGELPTLDTSAFLLNAVAPSLSGGAAEAERYVKPFCGFPTLESWKAAE